MKIKIKKVILTQTLFTFNDNKINIYFFNILIYLIIIIINIIK